MKNAKPYWCKTAACIFFTLLLFFSPSVFAQQKTINTFFQSWVSVNTTARVTNKFGFIIDLHERRNNFIRNNSFHFLRAGINYWVKDNFTVSAGYAHLWVAPTINGWSTFANENRIYQQAQLMVKVGKINLLQRLRLEERWQQKILGDKRTGKIKFTKRVRYLLSTSIPVFKNHRLPLLALSDEICVQSGKEIIYNTFDQNRFFIGVKQPLSKMLSFDIGYMQTMQQKASGFQYDKGNVFRLFFYFSPDLRKKIVKSELK